MCGLVGMAGNLLRKDQLMFRDMHIFDQVRGLDSTGIALRGLGGLKPTVHKDVGFVDDMIMSAPPKMFDTKYSVSALQRVIIGHNRAATVGVINVENAHPFQYGHITGAHNGTLYEYQDLMYDRLTDTDSQQIFYSIYKKGIEWTWKSFYGDAALTFWDEKNEQLNLIRNDGRPLWIASSKDGKKLYWASEPWMIRIAALRHDVDLLDISEEGKPHKTTTLLEPDTLYTYDVTNNGYELADRKPLEKKSSPTRKSSTTSTSAGRAKNSRSGAESSSTATHRYRNINKGWAKDLHRADKDSRGVTFKFIAVGSRAGDTGLGLDPEEYAVGIILEGEYKDCRVEVMTTSAANYNQLCKYVSTDAVFKTMARMRYDDEFTCRISSDDIRMVRLPSNTKPPKEEKEEAQVIELADQREKKENKEELFRMQTPTGDTWLDEDTWLFEMRKKTGGNCSGCCNPLDPRDAENIHFVANDIVVCEECKDSEWIQQIVGFDITTVKAMH